MKKYSIFTFSILAILVIVGAGLAATGTLPQTVGKVPATVQNFNAIAPAAGKSRCDSVAGTKAIQKSYSTAGYFGIEAGAYNATTGAAEIVRWEEDGKQVWVGGTYTATNDKGAGVSKLTYKAYSAAQRNVGTCIRRQ